MNNIFIFSPHSDDAALSMGGFIYNNFITKLFKIFIITIYTKSIHSPYINLEEEKKITKIRLQEDKMYSKKVNTTLFQMDYKESLLRGYDAISIFDNSINTIDDNTFDDVKSNIERLINTEKPFLCFFPSGIGNHIEHRILYDIGSKINNSLVLFYEDLPYAQDYTNKFLDTKMSNLSYSSLIINFNHLKPKLIFLKKSYPSQISTKEITKVKKYHEYRKILNSKLSRYYNFTEISSNKNSFFEFYWGKIFCIKKFIILCNNNRSIK